MDVQHVGWVYYGISGPWSHLPCRRDYIHAHPDVVPSLVGLANQINHLKSEVGLEKVFLASDAPEKGTH